MGYGGFMNEIIQLRPSNIKIIPAEQFPLAFEELKDNILSTEIIPPKIGAEGDFGSIKVVLRDPVYLPPGETV